MLLVNQQVFLGELCGKVFTDRGKVAVLDHVSGECAATTEQIREERGVWLIYHRPLAG